MDFHPIRPGRHTMQSQWICTQFHQFDQAGIQCNLNGFAPNLTRQAYNAISMDLHPIRPGRHTMLSQWICIQFDHLIRPGRHTMLSQWICTQFDQAGIQCNLNGFAPNLTRQAYNAISMDLHPI